jgi:hypothetical protein
MREGMLPKRDTEKALQKQQKLINSCIATWEILSTHWNHSAKYSLDYHGSRQVFDPLSRIGKGRHNTLDLKSLIEGGHHKQCKPLYSECFEKEKLVCQLESTASWLTLPWKWWWPRELGAYTERIDVSTDLSEEKVLTSSRGWALVDESKWSGWESERMRRRAGWTTLMMRDSSRWWRDRVWRAT